MLGIELVCRVEDKVGIISVRLVLKDIDVMELVKTYVDTYVSAKYDDVSLGTSAELRLAPTSLSDNAEPVRVSILEDLFDVDSSTEVLMPYKDDLVGDIFKSVMVEVELLICELGDSFEDGVLSKYNVCIVSEE